MATFRTGPVLITAVVIMAGLLPALHPSEYLLSFSYFTLLYAGMAVAWTILGGYAGYLSFGHVAFLGTGAYTAAYALLRVPGLAELPPALCLPLLMLLGAIVAGGLAVVAGSPLLGLRGPYFTVGSLLLVKVLAVTIINSPFLGGGGGLWLPPLTAGVVELRKIVYYAALAVTLLGCLTAWGVQRGKLGLGLAAIRQDEDVAAAMGVPTLRLKLWALSLSAALTGMAGVIYACERGNIYVETMFDLNISVLIVLSALLGGSGYWSGPLIGALMVRVLDELLGVYVGKEASRVLFGMLLALTMLLKPEGIVGPRR